MRTKAILLAVVLAIWLGAETTVWLRDNNPGDTKRVTNAVNGPNGTIRTTIPGHNFAEGEKINVDGVGGCYRVNGTRTVFGVVNGDTVDLKGRDGQDLECGGTFRPPHSSGTLGAKYYTAAKVSPYTLKDPPNVYGLDGPTGALTLALQSRQKTGNPAYDAMRVRVHQALGSTATPYTSSPVPVNVGAVFGAAMMWHAHGRSTCATGTITTRANGSKFCSNDATWEYLDMARWWVNNAETITRGPGCAEVRTNCGRSGLQNAIDQNSPHLTSYPAAYSLIYDQLTNSERTAFAQKFLNNVPLNNNNEPGCQNQYVAQPGSTLTAVNGNSFVMVSPANSAGAATIGQQIRWLTPNSAGNISDRLYEVISFDTSTGRININMPVADGSPTATPWFTVAPWNPLHCGFVWFEGHFDINTLWTRDAYPPAGGNAYSWQSNLAWWRNDAYMAIGATNCLHDVAGCELFERAQAFFYDQLSVHAKNLWTGFTQSGGGSYQGRVQGNAAMSASTLKGAVSPSLDMSGGVWLKRTLLRQIYDNLPGAANGGHFHSWGETSQRIINAYGLNHFQYNIGATSETEEAARARHWLFNRFPYNQAALEFGNGIFAPWSFLNVDPNASRLPYTDLPKQYLFHQTDLDTPPQAYLGAYSRTGWGNSDTSILMLGGGSWQDHWLFKSPGTYQIFNGNYLYADDRGPSIGSCTDSSSCFSLENEQSSSVMLGEPTSATATQQVSWSSATFDSYATPPAQGAYVEKKRWAGEDPTGRSDYTYLVYDAAKAANPTAVGTTVQRAWHHYLHLKANGRDYLLRYVEIALATPRRIRGFMHFPNNGGSSEGNTAMGDDGVIRTATVNGTTMATTPLLPLELTDITIRRGVNTNTLVFNENASAAFPIRDKRAGSNCVYTAPASVTLSSASALGNAYLYTDNCTLVVGHNGLTIDQFSGVTIASGVTSFPAGVKRNMVWNTSTAGVWAVSGYIQGNLANSTNQTRRFHWDCGVAAACQALVLHQINTEGSVSHASTPDWQAVTVDNANLSAVGVLSTGEACKTSWTSNTSHTGVAQYVVAGLCPGSYTIRRNSSEISVQSVLDGDLSLGFFSSAGLITVSPNLGLPSAPTNLNTQLK